MLSIGVAMTNLDQINNLEHVDKQSMLRHIQELPDQIENCWEEMKSFVMPANYIKLSNVVILGMGGSAVGGFLAKALAFSTSKVPIEVVNSYHLPNYVGPETLVIGLSYSGNTEETLTTFREAGKKKAKLVAITMGGELASIASNFKAPVYTINYGSQPRAALGYLFTAVLGVLSKLDLVDLGKDDVRESAVLMRGLATKLNPEVPTYQNEAKKLAITMEDKLPIIAGAGVMAPVAYRWRTQINENGKHLAYSLELPELCHNWLAGLKVPQPLLKQTYVLFIQSKHENERNRIRQNIIGQILRKQGVKYDIISLQLSGCVLSEMLVTIYLGDYVSYYMAILKDIDPTKVEEIEYLKKQLS